MHQIENTHFSSPADRQQRSQQFRQSAVSSVRGMQCVPAGLSHTSQTEAEPSLIQHTEAMHRSAESSGRSTAHTHTFRYMQVQHKYIHIYILFILILKYLI